MFDNELIDFHEARTEESLRKLFSAQAELIEAYQMQWSEMNYLIQEGQWPEKLIYPGNAYGMQADVETYVLQLDMPLPFLPNPYVRRFKESSKEYFNAKLLISKQLHDVIEKLGKDQLYSSAALLVKHYYQKVRIFDLDNKAKQVVINSLKQRLILDDNIQRLPYYSEEAIKSEDGNRTMLYLGPASKKQYMEYELALKYDRIDHLPGVIESKYPASFRLQCPASEDKTQKIGSRWSTIKKKKDVSVTPICNDFI